MTTPGQKTFMFQQKAKILLVDDLQENLHAMKVTLSSLEGTEIITAQSGNEALSLMLEHEFAVVLMDVQMPEMDGFETAALMQNHPATRNLPIIFVTAISKEDKHVFKGYASGAVDYLFKPLNHDILISKVRVFLNLYRQRVECEQMQKEIQKIRNIDALGVLAGGIAHDFNNLMTAVFANVELAKLNSEEGSRVYEMLEETLKAADQTRDLTEQLLIFSKGGRPRKVDADIVDLLDDCSSQYLDGTNINVHMDIDADNRVLYVDRDQICQVFQNIMLNAREAMPDGGRLSIRVEQVDADRDQLPPLINKGRYVRITFADNGPGIEEDVLACIFDPYFSTKERGAVKGQGLGLTIAHSIIQKHGGFILASSRPDEGTTFHVYLPYGERKKRAREKGGSSAAVKKRSGAKKLLILEDVPMVAKVLVEMLKCLGYEAHVVESGSEAVTVYSKALVSSSPFDGAILEMTVQDDEGGDIVLKKLRDINPNVKAIVFSDYDDDQALRNYKKYGFAGVIRKPFNLKILSEGIKRIC